MFSNNRPYTSPTMNREPIARDNNNDCIYDHLIFTRPIEPRVHKQIPRKIKSIVI